MRVVHLYATPVASGAEGITRSIQGLVHSLDGRGVDVEFVSEPVPLEDLNRRSTQISGGLAAHRAVRRALRDASVRLVHFHVSFPAMGLFARLARRGRRAGGAPLIIHAWNAFFRGSDVYGNASGRDMLVHRAFNSKALARAALACADALVVSSWFQERQFRALGLRTPMHVVDNGVDLAMFRPATPFERARARDELGLPGGPAIVHYGHLTSWKGVHDIVDALRIVLAEEPDAEVVLAHTAYGHGRAWLERRLDRAEIADRVTLRGLTHVPTLLSAADVATFAPIGAVGTSCHPTGVLEALASGVATVATDVGSMSEIIQDGSNGLLAPPGDPEALAERLLALIADRPLRQRLGAAAHRDATVRFSWDRIARRMEAVYNTLEAMPPLLPPSRPSRELEPEVAP